MTQISVRSYVEDLASKNLLSPKSVKLYRDSLLHTNIDSIDVDNTEPTYLQLLEQLKAGSGKVYIEKTKSLIENAITRKGFDNKNSEGKQSLILELRSLKPKGIAEYDEDVVRMILGIVGELHDFDRFKLFNAITLMSYSGLRVSACQGLKFNDFRKLPGIEGVRVFRVRSKGSVYTAAISEYAFQKMVEKTPPHIPELCWYDDGFRTDFDKLLRSRMMNVIKKYGLQWIRQNSVGQRRSIFHSFRHFFITQCDASILTPKEVSMLAGHTVEGGGIAVKNYIRKDLEKAPLNYEMNVANAYLKTPLVNFKIEKEIVS